MATVNLRSFKQGTKHNKSRLKRFLTRLAKQPPGGLDKIKIEADKEVWQEVNCLHCANCCKTMSPTYTKKDISRISKYLVISEKTFKEKWLYKDKDGDWLNRQQPCQFLDIKTNMCNVYEVRPEDCAGFPHHTKRKMTDYMHVYKQNVGYCPATSGWVEKIMEKLDGGKKKI
jgi:Fe-S-cluster containining protein